MVFFSPNIECAYEPDSVNETLNAITGHITASVTLRCAWADRLYLADDILMNRRTYPLITTAFSPIALTAAIVQADQDYNQVTVGQWRPPKTAKVTIQYGLPDTAQSSNFDVVAESLEPIGEFRRLDYSMFRWGSRSGKALIPEEAPGMMDVKLRLTRRIYRLTNMPPAALSLFGKVNNAAYNSPILGFTFATETILYDAPQPELTISSDGSQGFNLTQNFVYNPFGWNKYFNPSNGTWEYIYHVSSDSPFKSYIPDDFSGIL